MRHSACSDNCENLCKPGKQVNEPVINCCGCYSKQVSTGLLYVLSELIPRPKQGCQQPLEHLP